MATIDDALRLSARFPVFPCRADKKPACKNGYKDAVREPQAVVDLWRKSNGPLIGVPTGAITGIDVLDIDPRHDGNIWLAEAEDSLPVTRRHHTQSGGRHLLFHHSEGVKNTAGKIARGIDTRGDGGYVVWWPSTGAQIENPSTIDEWPKWLLKILFPPKPKRRVVLPATKEEADTRALIMIERAYERVRTAAPGQRHFQLRAAGATLGGLSRFLGKNMDQIENDLVDLIMQTGAEDRKNAEKTARWAVERGHASPLLTGR